MIRLIPTAKRALVFVGVVGLTTLGAGQVFAATTPSDQDLYSWSDMNGFDGLGWVDENGVFELIGGSGDHSIYGADYDATTGLIFAADDYFADNYCVIQTIDVTTGVTSVVGTTPSVFGTKYHGCDGIDVNASGELWVLGEENDIVKLDKTDAAIIAHYIITGVGNDNLAWLATDPVSGITYVGDYDGKLFSIDTSTWVGTEVHDNGAYWESADFDSNGVLWFQGSGSGLPDGCSNGLWSQSSLVDAPEFQGDLKSTDGTCIDAYSVFLGPAIPAEVTPTPEPTLAETGSAGTPAVILAGGVAFSIGVILLTSKRVHSRLTARASGEEPKSEVL